MTLLTEYNTYDGASVELLEDTKMDSNGNKKLCMKGIFLQADVRNHNRRVYPLSEISNAVQTLNERIKTLGPVPGECAHPDGLEINIDRISHHISEMWMDGKNGMGKLTLIPTPLGNIIRTLLENDVKLGVSSRGAGEVDSNGVVSDFQIITVDIVSTPSAPEAFPKTIYEQLMHSQNHKEILKLAEALNHDTAAQKYFQKEVKGWMDTNFTIRRK